MTLVDDSEATRVRIGFSTNIWGNPPDIVGHLDFLAAYFSDLEFEIAEEAQDVLFGASPAEYDKIVGGVREVIARRGLDLSVHAAWLGPHTDLCAADERERGESARLLRRGIRFAADIGATRVTYHPGGIAGRTNAELLDILRGSLDVVLPMSTELGITLCVEHRGANWPQFIAFTPDEYATLCASTGTAITLDLPHLATVHQARGDVDEAMATVAPHVHIAHIADVEAAGHTHLPIGLGDFDVWGSLRALESHGFAGPAIIEEFSYSYTPEMYLERGALFRDAWHARMSDLEPLYSPIMSPGS